MRLIFVLLLASLVASSTGALSQSVQRIAVVVNDEIVSVRDLRDRIRLVLFLSGIKDTADSRRRIVNQVLRSLVDERLQLQEAKKRNVSVSEDEVTLSVADRERASRMTPGSLSSVMTENRVSYNSLRAQFRARIAWSKLVHRRLAPRIRIGDDEVAEALARLKATEGEESFRLREIFLAVNRPDEEAAVRETAGRMVRQIRDGARFATLARQFSQTATAAVGGDLGWAARSELDPAIAEAVAGLEPGGIVGPIRTLSGFRILALLERRSAAAARDRAELNLQQIFVPVAEGAAAGRPEASLEKVGSEGAAIDGCEDLAGVAERLGAGPPQDLGRLKPAELSATIRNTVADVAVGKAGAPIRVEGGILLIAVCGRSVPASASPDRDSVMRRLLDQRLNLAAQRYLRDLRSAAIIDVRI